MTDFEPLKPETYLSPGELATLDQWETDVKVHVEGAIEVMREIEAESGPQSLAVWTSLIHEGIDPERMSSIMAYLILKESRRSGDADG